MPLRVLVLTPDTNLGDQIRRALVSSDGCQVVLAYNSRQANRLARQVVFDLAILDESSPDDSLPELARCLLEYQPRLNIVPLSPPNGINSANGSRSLPAEVQALLQRVEAIARDGGSANAAAGSTPALPEAESVRKRDLPNWALDPALTERRLKGINLPNFIYAAVVVRRESLWAYRGSLPRALAGQLSRVLAQSWSREQDPNGGASRAAGDMMRFVQLGAQQEFLLYARGLRHGLVLGLAFPATTPFNAARTHMDQVLRQLLAGEVNGNGSQVPAAEQGFLENGAADSDPSEDIQADLPALSSLLGEVPEPTPQSMRYQVPESGRIAWGWEDEAGDFPEQAPQWLKPEQDPARNANQQVS